MEAKAAVPKKMGRIVWPAKKGDTTIAQAKELFQANVTRRDARNRYLSNSYFEEEGANWGCARWWSWLWVLVEVIELVVGAGGGIQVEMELSKKEMQDIRIY